MSFKDSISALFGKIRYPDLQLENSQLELLNFLLDIFRIEITNIRFLPIFL